MSDHEDEVVLLDDTARSVGVALKSIVHSSDTPLHLAFSCYLLNSDGHVLLTRRSLRKLTWPGVWTNSFCGHPKPEESIHDAIERRATFELGAIVQNITSALPDFRYRATDSSGIVENEICPVFTATLNGALSPNPDEVAEWAWVAPGELLRAIHATPFAFSPWMALQLPQLMTGGGSLESERSTTRDSRVVHGVGS